MQWSSKIFKQIFPVYIWEPLLADARIGNRGNNFAIYHETPGRNVHNLSFISNMYPRIGLAAPERRYL